MLSDRDYMRDGRRRPPQADGGGALIALFALIGINVLVFMTPMSLQTNYRLALSAIGIKAGYWWQPLTYMFLHAGFGHILFNMYGLFLFGSVVAPMLGTARFLTLYFVSGLCGAGLWLLFNWGTGIPMVGASGAVFGVMMATAMLAPDMRIILLIPPIPMKMRTFAFVFAIIEVVMQLSGGEGGVAHLAHLGGIAGGYILIKIFNMPGAWDPLKALFGGGAGGGGRTKPSPQGWSTVDYKRPETVSQREVDRILDKISSLGVNALSDEEMSTLRRAREEMNR